MGVVQRQSIKASIFRYLGLAIGMLNSIFIYPFGIELYGFLSFVQDTVMLILPFTLLGIPQAGLKFFPYFRNKAKKHHDFLSFILLLGLVGSLVFSLALLLFHKQVIDYYFHNYETESWLNIQLIVKIAILLLLMNIQSSLKTYCTNFKRIAIHSVIELMTKVGMALIILGYITFQWSFGFCLNLFLFLILITILSYLLYLSRMGELSFGFSFKRFFFQEKLVKPYAELSLYSIVGGLAIFVISRIDLVMVGALSNLDTTGIYKISILIANIAIIPFLTISNVSVPIVAGHLKNDDFKAVERLYKNISITSLILGILVAIMILESIDIFYLLHPKGEILREGYFVIMVSLFTVLINMGTSINGWILSMSQLFRINLWITIFIAIVNTILNYIFINEWGIVGVTIATLISSTLLNGINVGLVYFKFKISPFQFKIIYLIIFTLGLYLPIFMLLPFQENHFIKMIYLAIFSLLYLSGVYYLKISLDINKIIDKYLLRK